MFRDTQEELERLQEQLLQEEEAADSLEQLPEEADFEALLYDADQGQTPSVYQNYSNDYGKSLRNFASGYQAYNTDKTDTDMDQYSQQVQQDTTGIPWWIWPVLILMASMVIAIGCMCLSIGGLG